MTDASGPSMKAHSLQASPPSIVGMSRQSRGGPKEGWMAGRQQCGQEGADNGGADIVMAERAGTEQSVAA